MPVRAEQHVTLPGTTASPATSLSWIPLDIHQEIFNVKYVAVKTGSGQVLFKVQGTVDNVLDSAVSAVAFDVASAATGNVDGNITNAMSAIRLQVTSASASSDMSFRVLQAGV